ncbi:disease resistance protein RPM1-like [Zingiber officinale]|uniref:disease resistance protein RPM1-like n=1 Tax=Zingiber officinale TaxID=94328 RepID=UPI001C4CED70|nr:disease resistance protein RPM1-like [Zingiber officinale]
MDPSFLIGRAILALAGEAITVIRTLLEDGQLMPFGDIASRMRRIISEFQHIHTFLSNVDVQKHNTVMEPWLQRAREIANNLEDAIDEFLYLTAVPKRSQISDLLAYRRVWGFHNRKTMILQRISSNLEQIEGDLAHLDAMKERYDIKNFLSKNGGCSDEPNTGRVRIDPSDLLEHSEDDKTIHRKEREILRGWLADGEPKRSLITVVGKRGVGKTTMVGEVYRSKALASRFDCKIWITLSKSCEMEELLTRILKELSAKEEEIYNASDLINLPYKVNNLLQETRYLLILDDVLNLQLISDVQRLLIDNKQGSRIVITTCLVDVDKKVNDLKPMKLNKLNDQESFELFKRQADIHDLVASENLWEILKYCQGLPVAIVAVARLWMLTNKETAELERIHCKLKQQPKSSNADDVNQVLSLCYEYLPGNVKNCFLYCSMFQLDNYIKGKKMIRLWVAENFVQDEDKQTKEEVAEEIFNELIYRSLLRVVEKNNDGSVRRCEMSNLFLKITLSAARKEQFSMVWNESEAPKLRDEARRLSVHDFTKNSVLFKMDFSRTRSLLIYKHNSSAFDELMRTISKEAKFMRVIDLENANIDRVPDGLTELYNLHYLGLRRTRVTQLPETIKKLQNLQTIDARYTRIVKLPKAITLLKNLLHLLASRLDDPSRREFHSIRHVKVPKGLQNLTRLQHLDLEADDESVWQLQNLTNIRVLIISKVRSVHCSQLRYSISQMPFLYKLSIAAYDENEVLNLREFGLFMKNLRVLYLQGKLVELELIDAPQSLLKDNYVQLSQTFISLSDNLRVLRLSWSRLQRDPLPALYQLQNLTVLYLQKAYDGVTLTFRNTWFPNLKELHLLHLPNLGKITIYQGSLRNLQLLIMEGLLQLMTIPIGIEFLASLQKLHFSECNPFFLNAITEQRSKVEHIPDICYDDGIHGSRTLDIFPRTGGVIPDQQNLTKEEERSGLLHDQIEDEKSSLKVGAEVSLKSLNDADKIVGIGVVQTLDSNARVGGYEIGPNWAGIHLGTPMDNTEHLIRPYGSVKILGDAKGSLIAWPCCLLSIHQNLRDEDSR